MAGRDGPELMVLQRQHLNDAFELMDGRGECCDVGGQRFHPCRRFGFLLLQRPYRRGFHLGVRDACPELLLEVGVAMSEQPSLDPSKENPHRRGQTSFSGVGRDLICGSEGDWAAALAGTVRTVIAARCPGGAKFSHRLAGGLVAVSGGGHRAQCSDRRGRER
jgi:hypothetical protein